MEKHFSSHFAKKLLGGEAGSDTRLQKVIMLLAAAVIVLFCAHSGRYDRNTVWTAWPLPNPVNSYSIHVQQVDAWLKGQVYLDVQPSPELMAMENPYDTPARRAQNVPYLWDRAYYEGKYYSYFGIAPQILIYLPCFFISGQLPSILFAATVIGLATLPFFYLFYREILRYFKLRLTFAERLLAYLGLVCGSWLPYAVRCADQYFLENETMMLGLIIFLSTSLRAMYQASRNFKSSCGLFCAAGGGLVIILWSRPHLLLLCALTYAVLYLASLKRQDLTILHKLFQVCAFLLPLLIGFGVTFWFNQVRFGSPVDFGSSYQLTVSDVSKNHLRLDYFFPAMVSNFLMPFKVNNSWPILTIQNQFWRAEGYFYYGLTLGLWMIPLNFYYPFLLLRQAIRRLIARLNHQKFEGSQYLSSKLEQDFPGKIPLHSMVYVAASFSLMFVAWIVFCTAGSLIRYNHDPSLPMAALSFAMALGFLSEKRTPRGRRAQRAIFMVINIATILFCILLPKT